MFCESSSCLDDSHTCVTDRLLQWNQKALGIATSRRSLDVTEADSPWNTSWRRLRSFRAQRRSFVAFKLRQNNECFKYKRIAGYTGPFTDHFKSNLVIRKGDVSNWQNTTECLLALQLHNKLGTEWSRHHATPGLAGVVLCFWTSCNIIVRNFHSKFLLYMDAVSYLVITS